MNVSQGLLIGRLTIQISRTGFSTALVRDNHSNAERTSPHDYLQGGCAYHMLTYVT
jgi:hypothetical protein